MRTRGRGAGTTVRSAQNNQRKWRSRTAWQTRQPTCEIIVSVEDLESLEETLDIMDSAALLSDIRESLAELSTADAPVLSKEDALHLISGQ
jgi:hypothetical protein